MFNATHKLSKAASEIWSARTFEDPYDALGRDADCGPLIERAHRQHDLAILERHGFTPEPYNAALEERLGGRGYVSHYWLSTLGVETEEEYRDNHTYVETCGELSSLAYLKA